MKNAIEQRYTHCRLKNCVQTCPTGSSHYEDPATGCVRLAAEAYDEERHFTVHANSAQSVTLVAIDKCLIGQGPTKPSGATALFTRLPKSLS